MSEKKPRGYIEKLLVIDCETTGLCNKGDDPSINPDTGETYQAVSWGLIVASAVTLKPIEELYVEVKWDGESVWSQEAAKVHGLTLKHLEANGVTSEEAAVQIGSLILKYWGNESPVCLAGHNVATFDMPFLKRQLRTHGLHVRYGTKTVDTNAIGFATFGTHNSDDLFKAVGLPDRGNHNALDDARNALQAIRTVRTLFQHCVDG